MPINQIPIEIITGFLGSGKTTFINELIKNETVRDAIILVNDFGVVNIDASLIEYQDDKIKRLTNGCMCCSLNGSLAEQIHACLTLSESPPTAIYIETSGVAKLNSIFDVINLSKQFVLSKTSCLVDASAIEKNQSNPFTSDIWYDQIQLATHIYLNRLPDESFSINQLMSKLNPNAAIEFGSKRTQVEQHSTLLPGELVSQTIQMDQAIEKRALQDIFNRHHNCLIRAKGIINIYENDVSKAKKMVVQFSSEQLSLVQTSLSSSGANLVLIGVESSQFNHLCQQIRRLVATLC